MNTVPQPEGSRAEQPAAPSADPADGPVTPPVAPEAPPTDAFTKPASAVGESKAERVARRLAKRASARAPAAAEAPGPSAAQIRAARRAARIHGIEVATDEEAIEQLRARGLDPFAPGAMLQLVAADREAASTLTPVVVGKAPAMTTDVPLTDEARATEIMAMQRDIARRRRRAVFWLALRLCLFVFLPTALAGTYFARVATPIYEARAEFLVQKSGSSGGGLGALFSGTALGSSQEAVAVQRYLGSMEAADRLTREEGYRAHFSEAEIDPLRRLAPDASREAVHRHYARHVRLGYDPTEGIVTLAVKATDADTAMAFAEALIAYAEEVVDNLSARQRQDQLAGAEESFETARAAMLDAQARVVSLQRERGVLSAEAEVSALMGQLAGLEADLRGEELRRAAIMANAQPNAARLNAVDGEIARLRDAIAGIRAEMSRGGDSSLAQIAGDLVIAEADLASRQLLLAQALEQLEGARAEAARQVGYLALNVAPVTPEAPRYPRVPRNTAIAFLIFAGLYLMLSITASVLREQVSA